MSGYFWGATPADLITEGSTYLLTDEHGHNKGRVEVITYDEVTDMAVVRDDENNCHEVDCQLLFDILDPEEATVDFKVTHDPIIKRLDISSDDRTANITIMIEDGQTHVSITLCNKDGTDNTRTDYVLGVDGYTQS